MDYPRKSYPHRCSLPCAKRSRPRAYARVYIIYRSPVGRSRGVSASLWGRGRAVVAPCPAPPSAGWGRAKAKADAPSRSNPHFPRLRPSSRPPTAESPSAKAECTRRTPPLPVRSPRESLSTPELPPAYGRSAVHSPRGSPPTAELLPAYGRSSVRSPRDSLSTAVPPPADGRSAERRVGRAKAKADAPSRSNPHFPRIRPSPCLPTAESLCAKAEVHKVIPALPVRSPRVSPPRAEPPRAATRTFPAYRPRPRRLNGHPASAGGRENDRMAHRRTATPTHRTPRGNDTCTIRVPRRKAAQSVVHNL